MESSPSSFLLVCCFIFFLQVFDPIPQGLASRKLADIFPNGNYLPGTGQEQSPPTLTYRSETRNGTHAQIVYVNGHSRSQAGNVQDPNGQPVIQAANHTGSQEGYINGRTGKPEIQASNTTHSQTAIINGKDGKPQFEVHKYDNGTSTVTVLGSDGKPIYQINYLAPPESQGNSFLTPPAAGDAYSPPAPEDPFSPSGTP